MLTLLVAVLALLSSLAIAATLFVGGLWRNAPEEDCVRTVVGALPESMANLLTGYEAIGFGPPRALVVRSQGPATTFIGTLTDPLGRFDLRFVGQRLGDPRDGPSVVVAVSHYPGGTLSTSPVVDGGLLVGEQRQTCRGCDAARVISAHECLITALCARGTEPLHHDPEEADLRYIRERATVGHAMKTTNRWSMFIPIWRGLLRIPENRAPVRGNRRLDRLANSLR
jgi:hypothetical protein